MLPMKEPATSRVTSTVVLATIGTCILGLQVWVIAEGIAAVVRHKKRLPPEARVAVDET